MCFPELHPKVKDTILPFYREQAEQAVGETPVTLAGPRQSRAFAFSADRESPDFYPPLASKFPSLAPVTREGDGVRLTWKRL